MIQMLATDPTTVQGVLLEQREGMIVLSLPGTDYQLHLRVDRPVAAQPNQRVAGRITARAKRVDVVQTGGRYIEPVYGRPRRLQGVVVAAEAGKNQIVVHCGCPFICELTAGQKALDFPLGALVSFDIERGATFAAI